MLSTTPGAHGEPWFERLRWVMDMTPTGMLLVDTGGVILEANTRAAETFGYVRSELVGLSVDALLPLRHQGAHPHHRKAFFENPEERPMGEGRELYGLRKDGTEVPVEVGLKPVVTPEGGFTLAAIANMSVRKRAEMDRNKLFELSTDMLCVAGTDGYFRRLNPAFRATLGYELSDLLARPFVEFVHPDDVDKTLRETEKLGRLFPTIHFENRYRCKDGTYKWLSWRCTPDPSGSLYAVARDITHEKREAEKTLAALREKEALLQEIHHRVKNNLQVVSSLIHMQMRKLDQGPIKEALRTCRLRVQTMALIHERLYQSADYARIPFGTYAKHLATEIVSATGISPGEIALVLDVDEVTLGLDRAIPSGLILNELITNALKHAFPQDARGTVAVRLRRTQGSVTLTVEDDGIGLASVPGEPETLGLQLVRILAKQIGGTLEMEGNAGTKVRVVFPTVDYDAPPAESGP